MRELHPGKELFIDDFFIESLHGAHRVLQQPEKMTVDQPLELPFEKAWERGAVWPGQVVYDEHNRIFRLYYNVRAQDGNRICVLESSDGLHWEYPELGLVEFNGSKKNNITNCPHELYMSQCLGILWDPHAHNEDQRWKRADNKPTGRDPAGNSVWNAYHSRDGYDWQPYPLGPHSNQTMLFNFGARPENFGGTIDPDAPYIFYFQRGSGRATRVLGRRDSADFLNWSGLRTVIDLDLDDPPGTEFYAASFDVANRTEGGLHLMMLHVFSTDIAEPYALPAAGSYWGEAVPRPTPIRTDGWIESQLAVSRDTVSWQRFREPFLPRGQAGAWDWGMLSTQAPIRHDEKLWFYYLGHNLTHFGHTAQWWDTPFATEQHVGKGLATLRPDGYVSIEATSYAPGLLTTHRFRQEAGGTVRVNVDASAGELRCEVLEDTGAAIPGFSAADCDPIRSDVLDGVLTWRGKPGWPGVSTKRVAQFPKLGKSGAYIKLRFHIAPGTKLYSISLDPPEVTMWRVEVKGDID